MNIPQFDEQDTKKKGGILAAFLKLFGGGASGSSLSGTALSGGGGGWLGGLFASKAGIMGIVLGGATIAAGIGVLYNFIGPSSKSVYTPGLFQDSYYESMAGDARAERSSQYDSAKRRSSSSLDYFSEEAQKGDIAGLASEGVPGEGGEGVDEDSASAAADADGAAAAGAAGAGAKPGLVKSQGFGSGSGASPRMRGGGGLSGGIGSKFQNIFRAPSAKKGKSSAMSGSLASRRTPGKRKVPHFNKKGAFGQAKYAGKLSKGAAYTSSDAGAKTTAAEAFEGQTAGAGDVAGIDSGGAGLGGAGLGEGELSASDPSLNTNESTPPVPPTDNPEDVSPWKKLTDMALYAMLAGAALIIITHLLANKAKAMALINPIAAAAWFTAATYTAYAAIAAGAAVIFAGVMLMSQHGQTWMGLMYVAAGIGIIWKAYEALMGINKAAKANSELATQFKDAGITDSTHIESIMKGGNGTMPTDIGTIGDTGNYNVTYGAGTDPQVYSPSDGAFQVPTAGS